MVNTIWRWRYISCIVFLPHIVGKYHILPLNSTIEGANGWNSKETIWVIFSLFHPTFLNTGSCIYTNWGSDLLTHFWWTCGQTHLSFCFILEETLTPKTLPLEKEGREPHGRTYSVKRSIDPAQLSVYTLGDRKANAYGNRIFCHILLFWIESEEKLLAFLVKLLYFQLLARSPRAQRGILLNWNK